MNLDLGLIQRYVARTPAFHDRRGIRISACKCTLDSRARIRSEYADAGRRAMAGRYLELTLARIKLLARRAEGSLSCNGSLMYRAINGRTQATLASSYVYEGLYLPGELPMSTPKTWTHC